MTEEVFSLRGKRVYVAGHRGMVGSAVVRRLEREGIGELITASRREVDLTDQARTRDFLASARPDAVFLSAAKVGGIYANDAYPAEFLYENLMIASNVIDASYRVGVEKLLFLGSSCIYPKHAAQPISEDALLTGPLEPTNQWYAIAKIAGIKLCESYKRQYGADFISAMPSNLYGPGDDYHPENSHVLPALIRKAHEAKLRGGRGIEIWGTGEPRREFLHVDDCADALVFLMKTYDGTQLVNVGSGEDVTIAELARLVMDVVGLPGELEHDRSKPDGTPRKLMDVGLLARMGWSSRIGLAEGIDDAYRDFVQRHDGASGRVARPSAGS